VNVGAPELKRLDNRLSRYGRIDPDGPGIAFKDADLTVEKGRDVGPRLQVNMAKASEIRSCVFIDIRF